MSRMHAGLPSFALLALVTLPACASGQSGEVSLTLPRPVPVGEIATIVVEVGALQRGQEVVVTTLSGQPIGTISPFGIPSGQAAGSYALPIPANAVRDGKLSLRLRLIGAGAPRAPTAGEVKGVTVAITSKPR
jgi:hypothetical protein